LRNFYTVSFFHPEILFYIHQGNNLHLHEIAPYQGGCHGGFGIISFKKDETPASADIKPFAEFFMPGLRAFPFFPKRLLNQGISLSRFPGVNIHEKHILPPFISLKFVEEKYCLLLNFN